MTNVAPGKTTTVSLQSYIVLKIEAVLYLIKLEFALKPIPVYICWVMQCSSSLMRSIIFFKKPSDYV